MSEIAMQMPLAINTEVSSEKGELDKHFESAIEAAEQADIEEENTLGFFQRKFPTLFMTPAELTEHLEKIRGRVEYLKKIAA